MSTSAQAPTDARANGNLMTRATPLDVQIKTEITDRALALSTFEAVGITYRDLGNECFEIMLGSSRSKLNLKTGSVDVSDVNEADFGRLRQRYAEHKFLAAIREAGATIHHREVSANGDIVITYETD